MTGLWINKIGIEVECGINTTIQNREKQITGFSKEQDGSLRAEKPDTERAEYVSDPVQYPDGLDQLNTSLKALYQIIHEINSSMGLHIHISLNRDIDYTRLASVKFHDWFIDRLKQSDLWENCPRLRRRIYNDTRHPQNPDINYGHYCKPIGGSQIIDRQLNRKLEKYRRITYMKDKYDTIEFRLFPAMESRRDVIEAIEIVTTSVNAYLRNRLYDDTASATLQEEVEPEEIELDPAVTQGEVNHHV